MMEEEEDRIDCWEYFHVAQHTHRIVVACALGLGLVAHSLYQLPSLQSQLGWKSRVLSRIGLLLDHGQI